jgi:hypothetical protein
MIIDPKTRPPSIQRLGEITVAKLEAAAMDSLANFFADTSKPKNAKKKPILKELFKVAKMEERYKRNEIGALLPRWVTEVLVADPLRRQDHPDLCDAKRHGHGLLLRRGRRRGGRRRAHRHGA